MRGSSAGRAEDEDAARDIVEDLTEAPSPDRRASADQLTVHVAPLRHRLRAPDAFGRG
jgi:hypothetical protein